VNQLGFQGSLEEAHQVWEGNALSWPDRRPPWRPSKGDIETYKTLANGKLAGEVLVLGATPEIRDLIALCGGRATIVDISTGMINAMKNLLLEAKPEEEIVVVSDWCSLLLPDNTFDLVIGDVIWWLLSVQNQGRLALKILTLLKKDGLFVSRMHVCNAESFDDDLEHIVRKHLSYLDSGTDKINVRERLISKLVDVVADTKVQRLDTKKVIPILQGLIVLDLPPVHKFFLENFLKDWAKRVSWTSQTREQIMNFLDTNFEVVGEEYASDYIDARHFPILALRKK